jgi:hypothetical protein
MDLGGRALSAVVIARWAFEALGHDLALASLLSNDISAQARRCSSSTAMPSITAPSPSVAPHAVHGDVPGRHHRGAQAAGQALI